MRINKTQVRLMELGVEFESYIDGYGDALDTDIRTITCYKCNGTGYIDAFSYIDNGICYVCEARPGKMSYDITVGELRRKDRERVNRRNRETLKKVEARMETEKALAVFESAHPGMYDRLKSMAKDNTFADSLMSHLDKNGTLTENQIKAAERMFENADNAKTERDNAAPVPEGKDVVTGTVVSVKFVPNTFAYHGADIIKIVVKDDRGFSVYGTAPSSLLDGTGLKGKRVTFNATLTRSNDDDKFGFYKRPTKAMIV